MFGWLRKKVSPKFSPSAIRDTLFGDMPLSEWAQTELAEAPWLDFREALRRLRVNDRVGAISALEEVVALPGLESRHYLQAWSQLRALGTGPTTGAKRLLGVVVEVHLQHGLDILAAYENHSARYFNFSGTGVVWDRPDDSLDQLIDTLLAESNSILGEIGVWEGPRPPAPPKGHARISLLTPAGLFFGQAPLNILATDRLAFRAITAATQLMQALIAKTGAQKATA